ncbi:MAG TPA: endonuclease/exonuclease/phosphatase family protein [Bacteroidia bacterium]|nr:endonuclease/exonuclease/phosphatase family protein [Bacteroidia bacterium]
MTLSSFLKKLKAEIRGMSYFNKIFFALNIIFVFGLLMSYFAEFVSPAKCWLFSFFGLGFPILVLAALFFVCYWLVFRKKIVWISIIVLIVGFFEYPNFVQIHFHANEKNNFSQNNSLKVLSYNVRLFDLYNWSHNKETRNKMFDLLKKENADIMCFQEFYNDDTKKFRTLDTLVKFQDAKNYHVYYTKTVRGVYHYGIVTFSKYPIVNRVDITFSNTSNNICIYTDIKVNNDTIRIYNMHLQSIEFAPSDYKYITALSKEKETQNIQNSKSIFEHLKIAFMKRATQVDIIKASMNKSPYPIIICGDFNDTPASYAYHTISNNLQDAFKESGNGFGRTYDGSFPSFRIDYIMHSKSMTATDFHIIHKNYSDHYPITCWIKIN